MNHDAYSDDTIRTILQGVKTVAMVGATDNPARPSYFVLKYLIQKSYRVFPINPNLAGKDVLGRRVHARLADVPEPIDVVDIFRRLDAIPGMVEEALALDPKPKVIWMQLGLRDDAAAARAEAEGVKVVMNRCMKIEYGRLCGEIGWFGVNSRVLSSRKPTLAAEGHQHLDLAPKN
jgi:predicted CoA-binding protein